MARNDISDILAEENQIFVSPDGVKFRIGAIKHGKKTLWRTEHMENGEWLPNNGSFYKEFENAQGEFAAWIRTESLAPMEPEDAAMGGNEDLAVPKTLPAAAVTADEGEASEALATAPNALPEFDYSGLDAETATHLQNLARRALESKQRYYLDMMEIVFEAHRELCDAVVARCDNGQFDQKESTFRVWCASIGVSKDTAYRLLQVQALMDNSTPEEQEVLERAPAKLLYAAAKPSAPLELVEQVKSGDITTHKQYQDLLAEIHARDAKINELIEQSEKFERALDEISAAKAEALHELTAARGERSAVQQALIQEMEKNAEAEKDRDAARELLKKTKARADTLATNFSILENERDEARAELAALRARPIDVAVAEPDPAEIERLAAEKAESIAAQRTALLEAQMRGMQQDLEDLRDSAHQAQASGVDTVFAFAVNAAITIDTLRATFLDLAKDLQEDDFWSALQPMSDAAWKIADIAGDFEAQDLAERGFDESEAADV